MFSIHAKGCSTTARTNAIIRFNLFNSGGNAACPFRRWKIIAHDTPLASSAVSRS